MKKAIVTTTINSPTEALKKFAEIATKDNWDLIIVGDKKTPDEDYANFCDKYECAVYLDCAAQEKISQELSDLIGWNCIQRRNFGLIYAYNSGAEIIATVDDDNIPYERWGKNVVLGTERTVTLFNTKAEVFDPLSPTFPHLWHRGYPIQILDNRNLSVPRQTKRTPLVQADMWDGSPDVDAICRISLEPQVKFNSAMPHLTGNVMGPFNSQNTFLHRDCFPDFFLFPHIGRMDDIWASYYLQAKHPDSVVYAKASVEQKRNPHDLVKDLDAELIGYHHSLDFVRWVNGIAEGAKPVWPEFMPNDAIKAFEAYRKCFNIKSDK